MHINILVNLYVTLWNKYSQLSLTFFTGILQGDYISKGTISTTMAKGCSSVAWTKPGCPMAMTGVTTSINTDGANSSPWSTLLRTVEGTPFVRRNTLSLITQFIWNQLIHVLMFRQVCLGCFCYLLKHGQPILVVKDTKFRNQPIEHSEHLISKRLRC